MSDDALIATVAWPAMALVIAGWFQHIYTCFTEGHWGFLIAGALFFPIAIVHGWGIWLGCWH